MQRRATRFVPWHASVLAALLICANGASNIQAQTVQFVYTSDAHYGITRTFKGVASTSAQVVNAAMIAKINSLSALTLPADGGINAGNVVGAVDYLVMTGDIANREETPIQSAAASWVQFKADYIDGLTC
jgi:hypothetical protein